jgi:predicted RNA-binding Zn-ribbon protein involved in translation (DUF1610 family)
MAKQTSLRCPNCGFQFNAAVESVVDATQNPQAKVRLLSNALNVFQCPNCGAPVQVGTPILYHDAGKELLLAWVPPELNLPKQERERAIGEMMRELQGIIPPGSFKSYMFQPREPLTFQGMLDTILQADGITPEMMQQQRDRVALLERLLSAPSETRLTIIEQNDSLIDYQLMQTLSLLIQRMMADGQAASAEQLVAVQQEILAHSTFGRTILEQAREQEQTIQRIADRLRGLGDSPTLDDFLNLTIEYAGDDQALQALVSLVRPVFDYAFFERLTERIGKAPAEERGQLETLREALAQYAQAADAQARAALEEAAMLLQMLVNAPDEAALDALISENAPAFDETFLSVLMANMQQAEQKGDTATFDRLRIVYEQVLNVIRESMPPELRLVNEMLGSPDEQQAQRLLADGVTRFGGRLIDTLEAVAQAMSDRGEPDIVERVQSLRTKAQSLLTASN